MNFFKGKRVWLTGASSGIGRELALKLASFGAHILLSSRRESVLLELKKECQCDTVHIYPMDITEKEAYPALIDEIERRLGGLDIVILNAGDCKYVETDSFDSTLIEHMIQVNFLSQVYAVEAVLPLLRRSSAPQIILMSSLSAYGGLPRAEGYGASKAAVRSFGQSLQLDLKQEDISVTVVCPGFVKTPLTDKNTFSMPGLVSVDYAAIKILNGIRKKRLEIWFPSWFALLLKCLTSLPSRMSFYVLSRLTKTGG